MRRILSAVYGIVILATSIFVGRGTEPTWDYAVEASATVQASPPQITLSWPQDTYTAPASYTVYRKAPGAISWGTGTTLAGTATSYTDTSVAVGAVYEYQITKVTSTYNGYGYVQAGINASLVEGRGKVILVLDNTYASALAA